MAGRGRGVAAFSFNVEALGIGRGTMPETRVGPTPLFPSTDFKAVPLKVNEEEEYMLALKQELRGMMQRKPHNIKPLASKAEVERYTERYLKRSQEEAEEWTPDWSHLPKELMPRTKKPQVKTVPKKKTKISRKETEDVLNKLDELAKKDTGNPEKSDEETENAKKSDEEELEEFEEEDIEEDNDYIESYFDNGEDFGALSDDNMDAEATY
ncbi:DNA-directed RNA polymerase III subunit RPC7 [Gouania willdenowi]|uniref:DNA-directed RNA polymerase III subunit n=1 Tax=Gouania willdenowi TaxID=441366 RepID=A0A8C5DA80_GOUWI|nr:DNA-directed RNA polymerase III subunit RPC7 [Gouania willdenowi]XP_028313324.1 DNA-directed RNA polymerase III subunit RPC7 [Gouania willdenowi]XP_028313325.1 DNA-directed RNA polymerase III subunit RPC7 [Gouania willdenowi]